MIDQLSDHFVVSAFRDLRSKDAALAREERFHNRGLSDHTIRALVKTELDFPEQLLFMSDSAIKRLSGVGSVAHEDIYQYKQRFVSTDLE